MPIPIRRLLIRELLVLTGLAVALLLGTSWWGLVSALDSHARGEAKVAIEHLDRDLRTRLEFAEQMGASIATLWAKGVLDPAEDEDSGRLLLSLLSGQSLVTVVVLVDRNGTGIFADRRTGEWTTTAMKWSGDAGTIQEKFWDSDGTIRSLGPLAPAPADFRERIWYRQAAESSSGRWTEPYIFKRLGVPGVTFAVPIRGAGGALSGALGIDLGLEELSQFVWKIRPTENSIVTISDHLGRALVLPRLPEFRTIEARKAAYLRPLSEKFLPVAHTIVTTAEPASGPRDPGSGLRIRVDGGRYVGERKTLVGPRGVHWVLSLAIPEDDLFLEARRTSLIALGLGVLILGILALRVLHVANRFGTPLTHLAKASEAMGRGEAVEIPPSDIEEMRHLGEAIKVAADALRERRKLEEQLRHSHRMETLGTLAGGVAHDFNNLLTTILGYTELLLDTVRKDAPEREALDEIRAAGERAARLTGQLLAFSRKQVLEPRAVDLAAIISEAEKLLRRLIAEDIRLIVALSPVGAVRADPGQIEQVLMNLVVNARDAMPKGGLLTVETRNVDLNPDDVRKTPFIVPGRYVALSVTDTGVGIDLDTQRRIFEPFFTTKARGKGTGLGLATAYGIVKQSGGYIIVESEVGQGTTFTVYLPRTDDEIVQESALEASPGISTRGTETILVAEDEDGVRALVRPALQARGYRVLAAESGAEALRLLEEEAGRIDLLLTDVIMPGMSGPELAAAVTARYGSGIKILFMSGYTDDALHSLAPGAPLIGKPFTLDALARRVRDMLDGRVSGPVSPLDR